MLRFTLLVVPFVLLAACGNNKQGQKEVVADSLQQKGVEAKPQTAVTQSKGDTLLIIAKAAVAYQPDSLQLQKRKEALGAEDFYIGADDFLFYLNTSYNYFQQQGLPVVDAGEKKYLGFVAAEKKVHWVKLDTLPDLWGIFLFHPSKAPRQVDLTAIEEEYRQYYQ